jgi:hypothetical protein
MESLRPRVTAISCELSLRDGSGRRADRPDAGPVAGKHHFQLPFAGNRAHGSGHGLLERFRINRLVARKGIVAGAGVLSPGPALIALLGLAHHDVDGDSGSSSPKQR